MLHVNFHSCFYRTFSTESSQGKSVTDSLLHKYGRLILRPADIKQVASSLKPVIGSEIGERPYSFDSLH